MELGGKICVDYRVFLLEMAEGDYRMISDLEIKKLLRPSFATVGELLDVRVSWVEKKSDDPHIVGTMKFRRIQ